MYTRNPVCNDVTVQPLFLLSIPLIYFLGVLKKKREVEIRGVSSKNKPSTVTPLQISIWRVDVLITLAFNRKLESSSRITIEKVGSI